MKDSKSLAVLISVCLITLFWYQSTQAKDTSPLRGQAFSDPAVSADMPADWLNEQINFTSDLSPADIIMDVNQQLYSFLLPLLQKYEEENKLR